MESTNDTIIPTFDFITKQIESGNKIFFIISNYTIF